MAEFGVAAALEVTVPDSELRSARQQIEDELGDVTVEVDASTSGGSGGGGSRVAGRERAMSRQLLTEANKLKESNIDLDETRNELLEEVLDAIEDEGFEKARSSGGGAFGAAALGIGVVGAIGGTLVSKLSEIELGLDKPDWVPLPVEFPTDAPGGDGGGTTTDDPSGQPDPGPFPSPGPGPTPSGPNDGPAPGPSPGPQPDPYPNPGVPDPGLPPAAPDEDPNPGPDSPTDVPGQLLARTSPQEVGTAAGAAALTVGGAKVASKAAGGVSAVGSSVGFPAPGAMVAQTANRAQKKDREDRGFIEEKLLSVLREAGIGQQAASFTADITNEVNLDGVTQRQLDQAMQQAKDEAVQEVTRQLKR